MPIQTDFLPAERLPQSQIRGQAMQVAEYAVVSAMLDTTPGMVAVLNPERQIVVCNDACAQAGGLPEKAQALGMRPGELLRCVHSTETPGGCGTTESCRRCDLVQALALGQQGHAHSGEALLQCHNQEKSVLAEYAVEVRPLPELGGGWLCFSLNDISGEKRREALEHTFFHDIMNRASAVEGISSALADDDMRPEARVEFIAMLAVSAHALVDEIRSHRTLLAAERGELAIDNADCNSLQALQNAVAACQAFGFAEGKQVAILPGASCISFRTDVTLLGRILINLLKNALEASDPGVTVSATCTIPAAGRIRFSVHNDTVMPDHLGSHVFQRSFSTKGSGRGLGTYSVRLLTESYLGGRVWFHCAVGHGTTFHAEFAI